jgi:hypothetical protein
MEIWHHEKAEKEEEEQTHRLRASTVHQSPVLEVVHVEFRTARPLNSPPNEHGPRVRAQHRDLQMLINIVVV